VIFDQFFWGQRVRRLGAGPAPLGLAEFSEQRLSERLTKLTSGRYDAAAAALGEQIRADDPVGAIAAAIETPRQPADSI
jgi:UDP:flavonoid glycosyltransferase YjiC (YdhE family)